MPDIQERSGLRLEGDDGFGLLGLELRLLRPSRPGELRNKVCSVSAWIMPCEWGPSSAATFSEHDTLLGIPEGPLIPKVPSADIVAT